MSDFKAKMHQIRFPLGLRPRPRWGSLQRSPDYLAVFKGPVMWHMTGPLLREEGEVKRKRDEEKGREGMGRTILRTLCRKFLATPLR